jgi:hypothetical protein
MCLSKCEVIHRTNFWVEIYFFLNSIETFFNAFSILWEIFHESYSVN